MAVSNGPEDAVSAAELISQLTQLPKAEAMDALKKPGGLAPRDFLLAIWSSLPVGDAIEWSTFLLCGATSACAPPGEPAQRRGVCGMVWKTGDTVYHCRTCGMDPSCAICLECFLSSDHEGHDYWMFSSGGGCCDCGDAEAWRPEGFCRHHSGVECSATDGEVLGGLPPFTLACAEGALTGWARLMLDGSRAPEEQTRAAQWLTALAACSLTWRRLAGIALAAGGGGARAAEVADEVVERVARGCIDAAHCSLFGARRAAAANPTESRSLLGAFLRAEGRMARATRESLHSLFFELMRDQPFKERLLCHIIEHYPAFVAAALRPRAPDDAALADSSATTFGKFTVQFKGNMVGVMQARGLLPMLLETLGTVLASAVVPPLEPPPPRAAPARGAPLALRAAAAAAAADAAAAGRGAPSWTDEETDGEGDDAAVRHLAADGAGAGAGDDDDDDDGEARERMRRRRLAPWRGDAAGAHDGGDDEHTSSNDEADDDDDDDADADGAERRVAPRPRSPPFAREPMEVDPPGAAPVAERAGLAPLRPRGWPAVVDARAHAVRTHLYAQLCYDLRYVLQHAPIARSLLAPAGPLEALLRSVALLEGMHPLARATLAHVERDDVSWGDAFSLAAEVSHLFPHVLLAVGTAEATAADGAEAAAAPASSAARLDAGGTALAPRAPPPPPPPARADAGARVRYARLAQAVVVELAGWLRATGALGAEALGARAAWRARRLRAAHGVRARVSFNLPLHRLLGGVVGHGAVALGLCPAELLPRLAPTVRGAGGPRGVGFEDDAAVEAAFLEALLEQPLRLQLACAQMRAHEWTRNGYSALKQAQLYRSALFADVGLAPDLALLQLGAARLGFGRFLRAVLATWDLSPFDSQAERAASARAAAGRGGGLGAAAREVVLEELLATLVFVLRERALSGDDARAGAARALTHRLAAAGASTHSELAGASARRYVEMTWFDELLAELATHTPPRGLRQGVYSIRAEAWCGFDPLGYPYAPRAEAQRALERWQETVARPAHDPSATPAAPPPPPVARGLDALRTAARCGLVHSLLLRALRDARGGASGGGGGIGGGLGGLGGGGGAAAAASAEGVAAIALRLLAEAVFAEEAYAADGGGCEAAAAPAPTAAVGAGADDGLWPMDVELSDAAAFEEQATGPRAGRSRADAAGDGDEASLCAELSTELFGFALPSAHSLLDNCLARVPRFPPAPARQPLWLDATRDEPGPSSSLSAAPPPPPSLFGATPVLRPLAAGQQVPVLGVWRLPPQPPWQSPSEAGWPPQSRGAASPPPRPSGADGAAAAADGSSLLELLCEMASDEACAVHSAQLHDSLRRLAALDPRARRLIGERAPHVLSGGDGAARGAADKAEGAAAVGGGRSPGSPVPHGASPARLSVSPGGGGAEAPARLARKAAARERQASILKQFASRQAHFDEAPAVQTTASGCACDHLDDDGGGGNGGVGGGGGGGGGARGQRWGCAASSPSTPSRPTAAEGASDADALVCVLCREGAHLASAAERAAGAEAEVMGYLAFIQIGVSADARGARAAGAAGAAAAAAEPPLEAGGLGGAGGGSAGGGGGRRAGAEAFGLGGLGGLGGGVESDQFVRLEDLTGPVADEVMAQVFSTMQAQHEADRLAGRLSRSTSLGGVGGGGGGGGGGGSGGGAGPSARAPGSDAAHAEPEAAAWLRHGVGSAVGVHARFCGHVVHGLCLSRALVSLRPDSMALDEHDFTCPLCRRVCNALLPALPAPARLPAALRGAADASGSAGAGGGATSRPFAPAVVSAASDAAVAAAAAAAAADAQSPTPASGLRAWLQRLANTGVGAVAAATAPPPPAAALGAGARHAANFVATLEQVVARQAERAAAADGGGGGGALADGAASLPAAPTLLLAVATTVAVMEASARAAPDGAGGVRAADPQRAGVRALWHAALGSADDAPDAASAALGCALAGALLPAAGAAHAGGGGEPFLLSLEPVATSVCALALVAGLDTLGCGGSGGSGSGGGGGAPPRALARAGGWAADAAAAAEADACARRAARLCAGLRLLHAYALTQAALGALLADALPALPPAAGGWLARLLDGAPHAVRALAERARADGGADARGARALLARARDDGGGAHGWAALLRCLSLRWLRCVHAFVFAAMPAEAALLGGAARELDLRAQLPAQRDASPSLDGGGGGGGHGGGDGEYETLSEALGLATVERAMDALDAGQRALPSLWLVHLAASPASSELSALLWARAASMGAGACERTLFIQLPTHYSELYNRYMGVQCTECGTVPMQPAVCLLCGRLVCAGGRCCRRAGDDECQRHAASCGRGLGVFVLLKASTTLLCVGRRHSFWGGLYLDSYGEEDRGLTRGRPLLLNQQRLQALHSLWASLGMREFLSNNPPNFPHLLLLRTRAAGH